MLGIGVGLEFRLRCLNGAVIQLSRPIAMFYEVGLGAKIRLLNGADPRIESFNSGQCFDVSMEKVK
jgi:hypothetical protein